MSAPVSVRASASTSNLGAGFDCIGVALDLWLEVEARFSDEPGVAVTRSGCLTALGGNAKGDRIVAGFRAACESTGAVLDRGVLLEARSAIPVERGLGSSAAAAVAGARAASALLNLGLADVDILAIATEIEGHADNAAAAVYGGAVLLVRSGKGPSAVVPLEVHDDIVFVFAVPDFGIETRRARVLLPEFVPHRTAAAAAAGAAALVAGLARCDAGLLAGGLDDVLHVPFRRRLIPGYGDVTRAARGAGAFGASLSGSGSSIVALTSAACAADAGIAMRRAWATHGINARISQPSIVKELVCR